jgi:uncharacterized cupredoxin-like copper-binding protein
MRRVMVMVMTLAFGVGAVAGCGDDDDSDTASTGGGGVTVPAATGTPVSVIAVDKSDTAQSFTLEPSSVKAGPVTFTFQNTGERQHEMVLLKTDTPFDQLEVGADHKVSEDSSVGEIPETDAGQTVSKTMDLEPGNYVLVCNIEKHYEQGMRVAFTVTP